MGKSLIATVVLLLGAVSGPGAFAEPVPALAQTYAPVLVSSQQAVWPDAPEPWTIAGQVEQESCVTLRSPKCWNPRVELKTYREYGFGLGQITVTSRFNTFTDLKTAHASLRDWQWTDRFNPRYQLTAIVEMDRGLYNRVAGLSDEPWAFALSAYNGGVGSVLQDRRLCANTKGCNPRVWFGNVERTSLKSKVPQPAYGNRSWFETNRTYVRGILQTRRPKYKPFWEVTHGIRGSR